MEKNKLVMPLAALALVLSAGGGVIAAAHADSASAASSSSTAQAASQGTRQKPAAVGTVTAVDGTTITLADKMNGTTYTVDASNATIQKFEAPSDSSSSSNQKQRPTPTTISVSDVKAGDMLMVQGTVSGSAIAATRIDDGMTGFGRGMGGRGVQGTVTAVNGSTLTVTGGNGTTYTVDASGATATKMETISVSDVSVGDTIDVQGDVSGGTVTAKHLTDGVPQMKKQAQSSASS